MDNNMVIEVTANPNANFTKLGGESVHDEADTAYREYRRRWMENPKNFIVGTFPIHLDIETTNRCNLRCTFCDKLPYLKPEEFGDLDYNLYQRIIDEGIEKGLCSIKLSYRGEPLLHKRIADMVGYARKRGVLDVYFNTNGMLLTESQSKALIDAGLNRISISVEGIDPVAFEKERKGAKFERICKNIALLNELRDKSGTKFPRIRLQTVALPHIDLNDYANFWSPYCEETAAIDYKEAEGRNSTLINKKWACPQLWQRMTIEWDGRVMPCNNDDYRLLSPGNINDISVECAWKAGLVNDARRMHKQGLSHFVDACNGCPWRTTQLLKIDKR